MQVHDSISQFRAAMEKAGIKAPQEIIGDGQLHRYSPTGDPSKKPAFYLLHLDDPPAGMFGDWRITGEHGIYWTANNPEELSDADRERQATKIKQMKARRVAERRRLQNEAARTAKTEWARAIPAQYHPYLERKGIEAHGARVDDQGRLLVPMYDKNGDLRNLERITGDGDKRGLFGGERTGLFFAIGTFSGPGVGCLAEGFSTAASIHECTGSPVVATFNSGNMPVIAKQLPVNRQMVVCGDDDAWTNPNIGRLKAEEAAKICGAVAVFPEFADDRAEGDTDFNDMARVRGCEAVARIIKNAIHEDWPPLFSTLGSDDESAAKARLAPRCIVEKYLYADVGQIAAAGGTGKTTLMLYESVCIALGLPLWGLEVREPGPTLFITKEDRKERLVARLREIMGAMGLTPDQRKQAYRKVGILDVTGSERRLLFMKDRNVVRTTVADKLIARFSAVGLAQIVIDPTISFGASESLVNDNEQGLVEVARHIVGELDCCLRYVHHTGQNSARSGALDQYASRGGTALPDGCRLVAVLKPYDESNKKDHPPHGCHSTAGSSITILARPKLSYAPPNQPHIWINRTGFGYEHFYAAKQTPEERQDANVSQLLNFLESRLQRDPPERFSSSDLMTQMDVIGMGRQELRAAKSVLVARGLVEESTVPGSAGKPGRPPVFLRPTALPV